MESPERALWRSVIYQVMLEAMAVGIGQTAGEVAINADKARRYLLRGRDLETLCDLAQVCERRVRQWARDQEAAGWPQVGRGGGLRVRHVKRR